MKSKIFLVCIVLTGCVLAQEDATSELPEKPEGSTKPELPPTQEGETSTSAGLMSGLNGSEKKALEDAKNAETSTTSGEEKNEPDKKLVVSLKSDKNNSSEETTPASSKEESSGDTPKTKINIDHVVVGETTPGEEAAEKPKKRGPKEDDSDKTTEGTTNNGEEKDKKNIINAPEGKETSPLPIKKATLPPSLNPVQLLDKKLVDNPPTGFKGADVPDTHKGVKDTPVGIGYQIPIVLADHKMTPTEQQAYVCSLDKCDLCPMTVDLDEQVGIAEPGANNKCKELAATMGYSGFCVVLMKTDPETGDPIYTRTCAYYDPACTKRSTCSTNFLTTTTVANATQVKYNCSNGVSHYIPTSCVKKHRELVLP